MQGFFRAILEGFGEETHASVDRLVCFWETGPFPYFHWKYSALSKYLDEDKDVAGIGDQVASFCSQFAAKCHMVEHHFNIRVGIPWSSYVDEVALEVSRLDFAICGNHMSQDGSGGHVSEL